MNSPVIFYHLWPVGEWERINKNIFDRISESGLSDAMSKMFICVNTDIEFTNIDTHGIDRSKVQFIRIPNNHSEWPTIDELYTRYFYVENTPILYLHCKGARFNKEHAIYGPVNSWLDGMAYFNINNWKKCNKLLSQGKPTVGIRVENIPVPHYSGNFWWINSNSLKLLPNPSLQEQSYRNRHGAEFWIGMLGITNLYDLDIKKNKFNYHVVINPESYEINKVDNKHICVYDQGYSSSWLELQDIEHTTYKKGVNLNHNSVIEAYLKHIITNYNNLPEYTYFLQSNAILSIPNLPILLNSNYNRFTSFGALKITDNNDGYPNHPNLPLNEFWSLYFEDQCPDKFTFIAGSNFGVSRKEILNHPISLYEKMLNDLTKKDNPDEDFCMERMWRYFFTSRLLIKKEGLIQYSGGLEIGFDIERPRITAPSLAIIYADTYGNIKDDLFNKILDQIVGDTTKYVVFINGNINESEFVRYLCEIDDNSKFEYKDYSFNNWKIMLISVEYMRNNRRKKKTIVKDTEEHIHNFMI